MEREEEVVKRNEEQMAPSEIEDATWAPFCVCESTH